MLTRNRFLLILIGALLAAFVLLASGLDSLTLSPAQPFDFSRNNEGQGLSANQIMPVIVFALALYVLIVALLLPRRVWQHWPTIAGILGVIALFVVAIMWGSTLLPPLEIETAETVPVEEPEETAVDETLPPPRPRWNCSPCPNGRSGPHGWPVGCWPCSWRGWSLASAVMCGPPSPRPKKPPCAN